MREEERLEECYLEQKDCFAYVRGKCECLKETRDYAMRGKCPFYKTKLEFIKGAKKK